MFAINLIYWKVELLKHVKMKRNNKCYWSWYVKSFHFHSSFYWQVFVLYFNPTIFQNYKIISQRNGKFVAYTPCLKCHVHNKLTGLKRVYVGIGSLVCIINLLITPVGNILMRFGYQDKGTEDFNRQWLFSNMETIILKITLVPVTHSYSDKVVLRRI